MTGWIVSNLEQNNLDFKNKIEYNGLFFGYSGNGQFENDKLFFETDYYVVCLDGVILNKMEFIEDSWDKSIISLIENQTNFPNMLRGSFNGFIFNKKTGELNVFVDHLGERAVFYSTEKKKVIISSNFNMLYECYKHNNISRNINEMAIKYILSFGYMIDDSTYIETIKRIMPGTKIVFNSENGNIINNETYHIFTNSQVTDDSDEKIINTLDELFRNAIIKTIEKNEEYGKKTLIDLSGGLDCRVINYVAKALGYTNIQNVSFSQINSDEYKVMMQLSHDLKYDLIFFPLDNANYIFDLDEIIQQNYGLSLYSTTTGVNSIIKYINFDDLGIEIGGLLGDMHDGAMPGEYYMENEPATFEKGMRFSKLIPNESLDKSILEKYENNEIFTVVGRGILAGYSTVIMRQHKFEFISPYADVDFYDYFLSIPLKKRVKNKILQKWISQCYPEAFKIVYDKTLCRIDANKFYVSLKMFPKKVLFKIRGYLRIPSKNNMNPFDYWYQSNIKIKNFFEQYYNDNINRVSNNKEIQNYMQTMFYEGSARDKSMVLTALAGIKAYLN